MSTWSELPEAAKDAARARYQRVKENGVGTVTVLGQKIDMGPSDIAAARGITVDEHLEKMYEDIPIMLELAKKLAPLAKSLGIKMEFK